MKLDTSMPNRSVLEAFNEVAETSRDFVGSVGWSKNYVASPSEWSYFYSCCYFLSHWIHGTDMLSFFMVTL